RLTARTRPAHCFSPRWRCVVWWMGATVAGAAAAWTRALRARGFGARGRSGPLARAIRDANIVVCSRSWLICHVAVALCSVVGRQLQPNRVTRGLAWIAVQHGQLDSGIKARPHEVSPGETVRRHEMRVARFRWRRRWQRSGGVGRIEGDSPLSVDLVPDNDVV